jgi:signal transduction histidine kinase/ActR/RegA family two-component response regulator
MSARHLLAPAMTGLVLVLTYLLVQATTPDPVLHEHTLSALRSLTLNDATLQRDVLRARTGLLRNYDPLVRSVDNLREDVAALRTAGHATSGQALADVEQRVAGIATAVRDQEGLIDDLKSRNALLQNSLSYFSHTVERIGVGRRDGSDRAGAEIGDVASAMLAFLQDPRGDATRRITAALDRLQQLDATGDRQQTIRALASHGRLVVSTLPRVDDLVVRLQAASISNQVRSLQDTYLNLYAQAARRASIFRILLYAASLTLALYVGHLFLQLRAKAQSFQARFDLEHMIAEISARFINLERDQIADGVRDGLARLARHNGAERAQVVVYAANERGIDRRYRWEAPTAHMSSQPAEDAQEVADGLRMQGFERRGCIHVASVLSMPEGSEKTYFLDRGIRSWLCIPMSLAGKRVGALILETVSIEKQWTTNDIELQRTAGEIFVNAIAREHSETERETLKARLNQAQRLESLGTLAGGIAHEFNNILGAILGYAEMALATLRSPDLPRRHVQQIMIAGRRAQGVIDKILAFARRSNRQFRPTDMAAVVAETMDLLRASLPATLTLNPRLDTENTIVWGDATQLQQMVLNLCTNAAQAMRGRGTIDIDLDATDVGGEVTLSHGDLPAGGYVRLRVSDTGHGIDAAVSERIFEPFFTTKPAGQGTGLGLPMVHGIVTQHGGALNIKSQLGAGSTVEVYLPRMEGKGVVADAPTEASAPHGHGQTILLVDDEQALVLLGEEMLAALGYEAIGFDSSVAALAAFRADPQRFDLVLTDEVMAGMTGTELATAVHKIRPELPIILMTGRRFVALSSQLEAIGVREVLKKPLLSTSLAVPLARQLSDTGKLPSPAQP